MEEYTLSLGSSMTNNVIKFMHCFHRYFFRNRFEKHGIHEDINSPSYIIVV